MLLALNIEKGYSADCVMFDNVVEYSEIAKGIYVITIENPDNHKLFDYYVKHVESVKVLEHTLN